VFLICPFSKAIPVPAVYAVYTPKLLVPYTLFAVYTLSSLSVCKAPIVLL
jgi:hypothetical protein